MRGPFDDFTPIELEFLKLIRPVPKDGADGSPKGFTGGKKVLSGDGSPQD
jgi:hypothetical protein